MKVLVTGGTGYLGQALVRALVERNQHCTVVSRSGTDPWRHPAVTVLRADPTQAGDWQDEAGRADAVVNLAGARLVEPPRRWTDTRKAEIRRSRIATTRRLSEAIAASATPPSVFLSGSAVGYYGDRGDEVLDERSSPGQDFLADLCVAWEAAARTATTSTRVVLLRTGLVLGTDSPLLQPMVPAFKLGVGGPWGSGKQWWPWIHRTDVIGAVRFAIDSDLDGPINLTAPTGVRVREFAKALGRTLHRPAVAKVPAAVLRVALGEVADALLASQRVMPRRLLEAGYRFAFPDLPEALAAIFTA